MAHIEFPRILYTGSLVKQLTGGDRIKARFMRQDFFEFEPTHKLMLAANHKPTIRGTDHAIWRRIKLIPFEVTIPKAKQDPHLFAKLRGELPGILAWVIRGCLKWQREGLGEPEEVRKATEAYRAGMDVLAAYIDERCWLGVNAEAQATPLFEDYRSWCDANGERSESQRRFATRLAERGLKKEKVGGVVKWYGIGRLWDGPEGSGPPQGGGPAPSGTSGPKTDMNDKNVVHEGVIPKKGPDGPKGPGRGSSCGEAPLLEGGADRSPPVVDMSTSQENDRNLIRDYLARAPQDFLVHAKKCAREGGVESELFAPLVSTVAYEVYGTAAGGRCEETRPEVEAWVGSLSGEA